MWNMTHWSACLCISPLHIVVWGVCVCVCVCLCEVTHYLFTRATWLKPHPYVGCHSWLLHMWDTMHYEFICRTWLTTQSYMYIYAGHDSWVRPGALLIHTCNMTHDSSIYGTWLSTNSRARHDSWLIHTWDMTHDSFIHGTWLMTRYEFTCRTWFIIHIQHITRLITPYITSFMH